MWVMSRSTPPAPIAELLIITDQSDTPTTTDGELDGGVSERVSAMPASSMITRVDGPTTAAQSRVAVVQGPGELCESVGADAGLLCEDGGRGSRRGQPIT